MALPKVIVFDLDGTLWAPEMYELWGGGAPFSAKEGGRFLVDSRGTKVELLADSRRILENFISTEAFKSGEVKLGLASTCDEPAWARECLTKFTLKKDTGTVQMGSIFAFHEIYKANKKEHFKSISKQSGVGFEDMIFFDNQMDNCSNVSKLGVHCVYTPEGQTMAYWDKGMQEWRSKRKPDL